MGGGERRCLSLVKNGHRYEFWYPEGREADVLASFVSLAADPDQEFDWFDAAVLSIQVGRQRRTCLNAAR